MISKQTFAASAFMILALLTTSAHAETSITSDTTARGGFWSTLGLDARTENKIKYDTNREDKKYSYDPGVLGTVTAIGTTTLTVQAGKEGTLYTVNTVDATIKMPGKGDSSFSDISVGDTILVQGDISGTTIDATMIVNAKTPKGTRIQKNLSGIAGTVTVVSGTTLTVKGKNDITYTVDADSARVRHDGDEDSTLSDITVGDTVIVQGTVDKTSVDASVIITVDAETKAELKQDLKAQGKSGFFHKIGIFFKSFFGNKN